jgi:acetate kinase
MQPANPCILTINGGSSSIKFAVYQTGEPLKRRLHGTIDRIALSGTNRVISTDASRATVRVIRTGEELMIARSVGRILEAGAVNKKD